MTAAETLQAKIDGLTDAQASLTAQLATVNADLARLQAFQQQLTANPDATALVEALWAEAQR